MPLTIDDSAQPGCSRDDSTSEAHSAVANVPGSHRQLLAAEYPGALAIR